MSGLDLDPSVQETAKRSVPSHDDVGRYEVRIRTMAKDLESLREGGGTLTQGKWNPVKSTTKPDHGARMVDSHTGANSKTQEEEPRQKSNAGLLMMVIVGVAVLFLIGFYVLPMVTK